MAEDARPFLGSNFQATLRDLETKMREAAGNLEFETAARLRDELFDIRAKLDGTRHEPRRSHARR